MITHRLVLVMICAVMLAEHLIATLGLPRIVKFLPEMLTLITILIVVAVGVRDQFRFVAPKYWFAFGFVAFVMVSGILINQVGTGPIVAGLRTYFRAIPFFFLPAVFYFTDEQIKQQLKLLLVLALLQVPIAAYQRWIVMSEGRFTGDEVFGTLQISSILSIFLISSVMILVGMRLRSRLGTKAFLLLCFFLLVPTMINETKSTVLLLPVALFTAILVGVRPGQKLRVVSIALALLVGFGAIFVPVYDYLMPAWHSSITDFYTDKETVDRYLEREGAGIGATDSESVGRADAIRISIEYMAREPTRLAFGLGLGNVSDSSLGESFSGQYSHLFRYIAIVSFGVFLLEIGLLGVAGVFLLYWFVFRDSLAVARHDQGLRGPLAIGWSGVVTIITLTTFYKNIHVFESISYLFWYFSGLVAARRIQLSS